MRSNVIKMVVVILMVGMAFLARVGETAACKVLVVNSYHEKFFRTLEIHEGIQEVLKGKCELTYIYMNALTDPAGVEAKAKEALEQYQTIQPDGVIAIGEEAQALVVKPHLSNKVDTPVMFNNIFFPEIYDYPTSNVSGIRLHWPVEEALLFAKQLVPSIKTVGLLFADEKSGHAVIEQISREKDTYPIPVLDPVVVKTAEAAVEEAAKLKDRCDALYVGPLSMLPGTAKKALSTEKLLFAAIKKVFGKPVFSNLEFYAKAGQLFAVKDFGQEQGKVSAEMLQKAISGESVSNLPIVKNQFAQRVLNKTVLKEMGITPSRRLLTGAEIVETMP